MHSRRFHLIMFVLAALLMLSQTACTLPPECDPESSDFDPDECQTVIGTILEILTELAFGDPPDDSPINVCPARLVCGFPDCTGPWQENGDMEQPPQFLERPLRWQGDLRETEVIACEGQQGLQLLATTPDGPGASTAAQVFQVFDYVSIIPDSLRSSMRRVRVQAGTLAFLVGSDDSRTFGVRIHAYAGDPSAFPQEGDPEQFLSAVPGLLAETFEPFTHTGGDKWEAARATLWLPDGTRYFVVFIEVHEEGENETTRNEFDQHFVDDVQVVIDRGNQPPRAVPDQTRTLENTPVAVLVLANDRDNTSELDPASVMIIQPPSMGTAVPQDNGRVVYTPNAGFVGTDTFSYRMADEEGERSNEAAVTITILEVNDPPTATDDAYVVPDGGLLIVPTPLGVLANDADPNDDVLTVVLVQDVDVGSLSLDAGGGFTYSAPANFTGTTFTYVADDGRGSISNEATVTLTAGSGYDLAITKTVDPEVVFFSNEATFTVVVTNHGPSMATGVEVTDLLDFGFTHLSQTTTQGTYTTDTGIWDVGELTSGQQATLTMIGLVHISLTNTATITGGLEDDTDSGNNEAQADVTTQ